MDNRHQDILELLSAVHDIITELESAIEKAGKDSAIKEVIRPKIKSALEHLRSCLDYCATDIYENVLSPNMIKRPRKLYFPYGKIESDFYSSVENKLPKLKDLRNDIYTHLESIQPYKLQDDWLIHLCNMANEHKHDRPKHQKRLDSLLLSSGGCRAFKVGKGSNVTLQNCSIQGNTIGWLTTDGSHVLSDTDLEKSGIQVEIETDFMFSDTDISVINLLRKSHKNITDFMEKLYSLL